MLLAETIKELVSFVLKGVDLIDHTSIFLLRTINHYIHNFESSKIEKPALDRFVEYDTKRTAFNSIQMIIDANKIKNKKSVLIIRVT